MEIVFNSHCNNEHCLTGFFQKLTLSNSSSTNLEQILAARLYEANNLFKKSPASLVTYALLYSDVLAFIEFLISPENLKQHIEELETTIISCSFLALTSKKKKNKDMSKGMAQKVQLLSVMAHNPEFYILDEPFSGLDPVNQQVLELLLTYLYLGHP